MQRDKSISTLIYKPRLDGLRGIAILMVLIEHFAPFIGRPFSAGFYGVNLFFVLSGFLITKILLENRDGAFIKGFSTFLVRRSLRIFPIYYLTIFILFILKAPSINERLPYLASYTYNYELAFLNFPAEPYSPFWSLSVEEQFYLFYPLIVLGIFKKKKHLSAFNTLIIIIAGLQLFFNIFSLQQYNYVSLLTNMAPLCLGGLGAMIPIDNKRLVQLLGGSIIEVLILFLIFLVNTSLDFRFVIIISGFLNTYLVVKAYYFKMHLQWFDNFLLNKKLVLLGTISYGVYLFHNIINFYTTKFVFDPIWFNIPFQGFGIFSKIQYHSWIFKFPIYTFVSILLAYYSFNYFERPFLKLRNKYFKT